MSYDIVQELVDQLDDEASTRARIKVIRRLAAMGDPRAVTQLRNIYLSEEELPEVKQAAEEALGVFKAIKEAIDQRVDVELPDPNEVKDPPVSSEMLRRIVILLGGLMGIVWVINAALLLFGPGGSTAQSTLTLLQNRYDQVRRDADNLQRSWTAQSTGGGLDCTIPPPAPESTNAANLLSLTIAEGDPVELSQARDQLIAAINPLSLAAGNWLIGCQANEFAITAEQNLAFISDALIALDQAGAALALAEAAITGQPGIIPPAGETVEAPVGPPTDTPTPTTEPSPTPALDPSPYIREMRERIDLVMAGRGIGVLLPQFWADLRASGQTGGCRQLSDPNPEAYNVIDYNGITPDIAAQEPRLQDIAIALNLGMALARDSLFNFQQGCQTGNFGVVLEVGQQQMQQAVIALEGASQRLDELQATRLNP